MSSVRSLLRDPTSLWPNVAAVGYVLLTYFGGWWALFQGSIILFAFGVLAIAHGMSIAAYLMHDCGHNSIFKDSELNSRLGRWLNVICGSNYGTYEDMRYKHMRHHVDNCEPVTFDYRSWLKKHPAIHRTVNTLEWAYIPAVEFIMHGMQIIAPFVYQDKRDQRGRVLRVALLRFSLFILILWISPLAALGYVIAYTLFITFLRFMDNFQHSYEIFYRLNDPQFVPPLKGNVDYEQSHTYTNLLSQRWPWLNLLALNFSYHNAHHAKPTLSWHRLPELHASLYPQQCPQQLTFWPQLKQFHLHRVSRVLSEHYGEDDVVSQLRNGDAIGVNALSFLTAF
ncbi:MAG: fatty acid desaturase [Alcanivoracaceae bacterium]|jgi:fatty acid desaturase|nr:fatty acid desaturase [Alcanivoracaceae bacterium]